MCFGHPWSLMGPGETKTDGSGGWAGEDSKLELEQIEPSLQFQWS